MNEVVDVNHKWVDGQQLGCVAVRAGIRMHVDMCRRNGSFGR